MGVARATLHQMCNLHKRKPTTVVVIGHDRTNSVGFPRRVVHGWYTAHDGGTPGPVGSGRQVLLLVQAKII